MTETRSRPRSPHLQIYRPQITSVLSIAHRATGVALAGGLAFLVLWLASAASGPETFDAVASCMGSWLGYVVLFGFSVCLVYHLLNGIRHLFWDLGRGFELKTVELTGWLVVASTLLLTAAIWIVGLWAAGKL